MTRAILEIHVDACAQLGRKTVSAVEALKRLYDATGAAELRYVETEQGVREKAHRSHSSLLGAIADDPDGHGAFLRRNADWVDIVETGHCQEFERRLKENIIPQIAYSQLEAVEALLPGIERTVRENMKRSSLNAPENITFPFVFLQDRLGRGRGRKIADPLLSNSINPHMKAWKKTVKDHPVLQCVRNAHHKNTLITLIRATQEARAIVFEMALRQEPQLMEAYGFTESPLHLPKIESLDVNRIRDHAHEYPAVSFLVPPFSELHNSDIVTQALRMTDLWPWHFRQSFEKTAYGAMLRDAQRDRADGAALHYFFNHFSQKPDVDDRAFLLITHDKPLIDDLERFRDGKEARTDPRTKKRYTYIIPDKDYFERGLRKPVRSARGLHPYGEALTSEGLAKFLREELSWARKYKGRAGVSEAIEALEHATDALEHSSRKDFRRYPHMHAVMDVRHVGPVVSAQVHHLV